MEKNKEKVIERFFRTKYPDERFIIKQVSTIDNMFGMYGEKVYVIEFIDTKVRRPKTMELMVKERQLINF